MDDLKLYAKSEIGLESLVNTVRIFKAVVGMDFGVTQCAKLVVRCQRLRVLSCQTEGRSETWKRELAKNTLAV